jgi:hypothetical protein
LRLPTQNVDQHCVDTAWQAYRDKEARPALLASLGNYAMHDAKIKMLGVFETVGALGVPALWGGIEASLYGFLSTDLHENVQNAYHAVAIDEQRMQFPPTLWTAACGGAEQVMEQTWFTGVHCDIGGGYAAAEADNGTRLADISLAWMLARAQLLGLQFDPSFSARYASLDERYALNQMHNSHTGVFAVIPPRSRTIASNAILANSVAIRCRSMEAYTPGNLVLNGGVVDTSYNVARTVQDEA